ncbi:MAG: DUF2339 domain-containing protein, partial [Verrucomicrobiae bacterium]|nr:DUF2339 domain-containing protein [Verrucomicrobiae bacterium]
SAYHALENPWELISLAGIGVILVALGRFGGLPSSQWWSIAPTVLAVMGSWMRILGLISTPPTRGLVAISLAASPILLHGILITWHRPRSQRSFAWIHGLAILAVIFPAFAVDRLGVESLTTVCWGIASIILFITGFASALRPYRLAGLIGLFFAIVRMFIIDIEDPLYRIYAFFVIALVLLGMGYLYHRFRHLIDQADRHLSGKGNPAAQDSSP